MLTPMTIWTDLETMFRALGREGGDFLLAHWDSTGWNENGEFWLLSGNQNRHVRDRFESLAMRAAAELGHGAGQAGVHFWLDVLQRESPYFQSGRHVTVDADAGSSAISLVGYIERLCEASAGQCFRLQTLAMAKDHPLASPPRHSTEPHSPENTMGSTKERNETHRVRSAATQRNRLVGCESKAAARRSVVLPALRLEGLTRCKWATRAGVDPSVVYDYLDGLSNPRPHSRQAMAEVLKLDESSLP